MKAFNKDKDTMTNTLPKCQVRVIQISIESEMLEIIMIELNGGDRK